MLIFDHKIDAVRVIAPGLAHTEPCKISITHNHANSHCAEAGSKHAKTCQYTTWQKFLSKQDLNMAVCHLKHFRKSNLPNMSVDRLSEMFELTGQKHSNTACQKFEQTCHKHCNAPLEAFSDTKHAKTCQDTIRQTCQTMSGYHLSNMAVDHLKTG